MLKVLRTEGPDQSLMLHVEGRLVGPWVGELREACGLALAERHAVTLDLSGVSFVDAEGAKLLLDFEQRPGVDLAHATLFVSEVLKGGTR